MGKQPASEWERLVMFRELATEFFQADAALSDPGQPRASADSPEGQRAYWVQLFKLMMLRKFFASGDQVRLPKVAVALRLCNHDKRPDVEECATNIESGFWARDLAELQKLLGALLPDGDGADPLELLLYGRLLHADADKFRFTQGLYDFDRYILSLVASADLQKSLQYALLAVGQCMDMNFVRECP